MAPSTTDLNSWVGLSIAVLLHVTSYWNLPRFSIMMKCWEQEPKVRPTFSEVVTNFSELLTSVADYFTLEVNNEAVTSLEPQGSLV